MESERTRGTRHDRQKPVVNSNKDLSMSRKEQRLYNPALQGGNATPSAIPRR